MRERPILFSAPMVRAFLDGRKTQTRRIISPQPPPEAQDAGVFSSPGREYDGEWHWLDSTELEWASIIGEPFRCPYGVPGDRLWGREAWRTGAAWDRDKPRDIMPGSSRSYEATDEPMTGRLRPGMFMPRWASRITADILDIRVERLQAISEDDACEEGLEVINCTGLGDPPGVHSWPEPDHYRGAEGLEWEESPVVAYRALWDHINGVGAWERNPWVWAVVFNPARDA